MFKIIPCPYVPENKLFLFETTLRQEVELLVGVPTQSVKEYLPNRMKMFLPILLAVIELQIKNNYDNDKTIY